MKITVLDMDTAAIDGDLPMEGLSALGELRVFGGTDPERTAARIGDADAVICNKSRMTREVMERCPRLRYIGLTGTGFDQVDLRAAKEHGIMVCNVPAYSSHAVAQHTFALILHHYSRVAEYACDCDADGWTQKKYLSVFGLPTHELAGRTIGLVGCGGIGQQTAAIALAFGMKVLVYVRHPEALRDVEGIRCVSLPELLRESDIVSLHCPLHDGTREIINRETLALMKPTALLVNTARGGLINESDLADALRGGRIAAAAVDVLTQEPMREDCPLRGIDNLTITPHVAWAPMETRARLWEAVRENLRCWREGHPRNVVTAEG